MPCSVVGDLPACPHRSDYDSLPFDHPTLQATFRPLIRQARLFLLLASLRMLRDPWSGLRGLPHNDGWLCGLGVAFEASTSGPTLQGSPHTRTENQTASMSF